MFILLNILSFFGAGIPHDFSLGIVVVVYNNKEFFRGSTTNTSMSSPSQSNEGQYPFITYQVYSTFLVVSINKFSTSRSGYAISVFLDLVLTVFIFSPFKLYNFRISSSPCVHISSLFRQPTPYSFLRFPTLISVMI